MGPGTEDEPIFGLGLRVPGYPALGIKDIGVRIDKRVMQSWIAGRDDHRAFGHSIARREREILFREVGNEDDGRPVAEELLDDRVGVGERLQHGQVEGPVLVAAPRGQVLLPQTTEHVGALGEDLEQPGRGAAGRVLRREEEGEERLADLLVREPADEVRRSFRPRRAPRGPFAVPLGFHHVEHPVVHDTRGCRAGRHVRFAGGRAARELGVDGFGRPPAPPRLGEGDVYREWDVHQLEGVRDEVEVIGDSLDGILGYVVPEEGAARDRAVDLAKQGHESRRTPLVRLAGGGELVEVVGHHILLCREICGDGLVREQRSQPPSVLGMGLSMQENPGLVANDVLGNRDETWFGVCGRLENFVGYISVGGEDNKPVQSDRMPMYFPPW